MLHKIIFTLLFTTLCVTEDVYTSLIYDAVFNNECVLVSDAGFFGAFLNISIQKYVFFLLLTLFQFQINRKKNCNSSSVSLNWNIKQVKSKSCTPSTFKILQNYVSQMANF